MSDLTNMKIHCESGKLQVECKLITEPQEPIAHQVIHGYGYAKNRCKDFRRTVHMGWAKRLDTQEFIAYVRVLAADINATEESRLEELPPAFATAVFGKVNVDRALEANNVQTITNEDGTTSTRPFLPSSIFAQRRNFYIWKERIVDWWRRTRKYFLSKPKYWKRKQNLVAAFSRDFPVFLQLEKRLQWLSQIVVRFEDEQKTLETRKTNEQSLRETQAAEKRAYKEEQKAKREAEEKKRFEEDSDSSDSDSEEEPESKPAKASKAPVTAAIAPRKNFDADSDSDSDDEDVSATAIANAKKNFEKKSSTASVKATTKDAKISKTAVITPVKRKDFDASSDSSDSEDEKKPSKKQKIISTKKEPKTTPSKWARFDDSDSDSDSN